MKKILSLLIFSLVSYVFANNIEVKPNFDNSNYEIYQDDEILKTLPFDNYGAFQVRGDNVFFLDFTKTRKEDYGLLCFYNTKNNKTKITHLCSGLSYFITSDSKYILVTSPFKSLIEKDISNVFDTNENCYEEYLLNLTLYDLASEKLLKQYEYNGKKDDKNLKYISVDMFSDDKDRINIIYGLMDSSTILFSGYVDLQTFDINIDNLSSINTNTQTDINDKWQNEVVSKCPKAFLIEGIDVIKQNVSCGYAVIQMFSQWATSQGYGNIITEEMLQNEYGKVVTSTGKKFLKEMNKRFPDFTTTMYKDLSCEEFIIKAYNSLEMGIPIPFEWAAKLNDKWTLHYSLIIGMDIPSDKITVLNPYGYKEEITIEELLKRTSFEAFENMPFYFSLGFAFGVFERNALFIVSPK